MTTIERTAFMSEERACTLPGNSFTGLISITEPDRFALINAEKWGALLRLQFHDVDKPWQNYVLFTENDAQDIIDWLKEYENTLLTVLVHCAQGISRSAAVAKFIAEVYSLDFPKSYSSYNKHVYNLLRKKYYGYDPVTDSAFLGDSNNG